VRAALLRARRSVPRTVAKLRGAPGFRCSTHVVITLTGRPGNPAARRVARDRPGRAETRIGEPRANDNPSQSQTATLQPLATPLTGVRSYCGWMYLGEPVTSAAAAMLRPAEVISLTGVPIATAYEQRLPDTAAVIFAVYATALDISELEGLPGGSVLLLDDARCHAARRHQDHDVPALDARQRRPGSRG
jgi:hypothetical protein